MTLNVNQLSGFGGRSAPKTFAVKTTEGNSSSNPPILLPNGEVAIVSAGTGSWESGKIQRLDRWANVKWAKNYAAASGVLFLRGQATMGIGNMLAASCLVSPASHFLAINPADGSQLWQKNITTALTGNGVPGQELMFGVKNGYVYAPITEAGGKVSLAKLSLATGSLSWGVRYEAASASQVTSYHPVIDDSDNVYWATTFYNSPYLHFVEKLNSSGTRQWIATLAAGIGNTRTCRGQFAMCMRADGNIAVAGRYTDGTNHVLIIATLAASNGAILAYKNIESGYGSLIDVTAMGTCSNGDLVLRLSTSVPYDSMVLRLSADLSAVRYLVQLPSYFQNPYHFADDRVSSFCSNTSKYHLSLYLPPEDIAVRTFDVGGSALAIAKLTAPTLSTAIALNSTGGSYTQVAHGLTLTNSSGITITDSTPSVSTKGFSV